jgi:hypothetical protein
MLQVKIFQKLQVVHRDGRDWRAPGLSGTQPGAAEFCGGLRCHLSVVRHLSASKPLPGMLAKFNVSTICSATSHAEGTITLRVYQLTSAMQGTVAMPEYVERQMIVTIAQ